jgi:protein-disulfide isomerase
MTIGDFGGQGPRSKNERRAQARQKALAQRARQQRREKRNRAALQIGIIVVILAVVGGVTIAIIGAIRPPSAGPANMASGGITIGADYKADRTAGLASGKDPATPTATASAGVPLITTYEDFMCPVCGQFESTNAKQIAALVKSGQAKLQIVPVSILDRSSSGTDYSTRAANAAACVANFEPDSFFEFHRLLYAHQPKEGSTGLTDAQLIAYAKQAGASSAALSKCVTSQKYANWIGAVTDKWEKSYLGTPTVLVNGHPYFADLVNKKEYSGSLTSATDFANFVLKTASAYTGTPTPSAPATPSPSPSPSKTKKK